MDNVKISVNVQARDLEYIGAFIAKNNFHDFEDLYDIVKVAFRVATPPTGNTSVTVDGATTGQWIAVMNILRNDPVAIGANVFSRLDTILRAKNDAWMTGRLDEALATATQAYTDTRARGRFILSRKQA